VGLSSCQHPTPPEHIQAMHARGLDPRVDAGSSPDKCDQTKRNRAKPGSIKRDSLLRDRVSNLLRTSVPIPARPWSKLQARPRATCVRATCVRASCVRASCVRTPPVQRPLRSGHVHSPGQRGSPQLPRRLISATATQRNIALYERGRAAHDPPAHQFNTIAMRPGPTPSVLAIASPFKSDVPASSCRSQRNP
jgi:hypothetical protein